MRKTKCEKVKKNTTENVEYSYNNIVRWTTVRFSKATALSAKMDGKRIAQLLSRHFFAPQTQCSRDVAQRKLNESWKIYRRDSFGANSSYWIGSRWRPFYIRRTLFRHRTRICNAKCEYILLADMHSSKLCCGRVYVCLYTYFLFEKSNIRSSQAHKIYAIPSLFATKKEAQNVMAQTLWAEHISHILLLLCTCTHELTTTEYRTDACIVCIQSAMQSYNFAHSNHLCIFK